MTVGKAHVYCTRENFEESVTRVFKILQRLSQCKWENMWVSFFSPDGSRESTPIGCSKCWLNITIFSTEPEMWDNIQRVWFYMTKKTKDSSDRVSWPSKITIKMTGVTTVKSFEKSSGVRAAGAASVSGTWYSCWLAVTGTLFPVIIIVISCQNVCWETARTMLTNVCGQFCLFF